MASSSGIKSKKKLAAKIQDMNKDLKRIEANIITLSQNLNQMMKGDADGPYWNGDKAAFFYNKAKQNFDNNMKDYESAYKTLMKLAVEYENAVRADKK